jgi:hypothetical protein
LKAAFACLRIGGQARNKVGVIVKSFVALQALPDSMYDRPKTVFTLFSPALSVDECVDIAGHNLYLPDQQFMQ